MTKKFKDFMESDLIFEENQEDFDSISGNYDHFFTEVGQLMDSLDSEKIGDDTNNAADVVLDAMIDFILTLGEEEFDDKTDKHFMDIVKILGLDDEMDIEEGLNVKHRKTNSGRKKSQASRNKGANKLKYLKRLKARRKIYKKNASLRQKTKRKAKKYRKTAKAKQVVRKYKSLHH